MASVTLSAVSKSYGDTQVVGNVSCEIAEGELVVILGSSGCGKTTTLRMIAGFVAPTSGQIRIAGEDVTNVPPRMRNIGMVFQNYALFPNMSVAENIAFGLRQRRTPRAAIAKRVAELLELVHLPGRGDEPVQALSGGQQQRVALARALAPSPRVLLMDEPLSALDLKLREAMRDEIQRIQRELKITTLLVTHDQQEALAIADRIILMGNGDIQQIGPPGALYAEPATPFVAEFIGKNNLLEGKAIGQKEGVTRVQLTAGGIVSVRSGRALTAGAGVTVSVRPEALRLMPGSSAGPDSDNQLDGVVERCRYLGNVTHTFVRMRSSQLLLVETALPAPQAQPGDSVIVAWHTDSAIAFPAEVT